MNGLRNISVVLDVQENDQTCISELDKRREDRQEWIARLKKRVMADTISSAGKAATATNENNSNIWVPSIYRIPKCLREVDLAAYEPQVLSLGPYHHGKPQFRAMDELKWGYFQRFLSRNPEKDLDDYLALVEELESQARVAYSELESPVDREDFIEMMMLDCCFILEFLLIHSVKEEQRKGGEEEKLIDPISNSIKEEQGKGGEEEKLIDPISNSVNEKQGKGGEKKKLIDPISNSAWTMPFVMRDILLLENQLPFFLLERLLQLNIPQQTPSLPKIVRDRFWTLMPGKIQGPPTDTNIATSIPIHHILHLMYSYTIPTVVPKDCPNSPSPASLSCLSKMLRVKDATPEEGPKSTSRWRHTADEPTLLWIPCAKKLREAGVVFKRKRAYASFLDVTFNRGIIEIPPLQIFGYIDSIFRNLIAFEQCHTANDCSLPLYISAYAYLMNFLVDTPADVQLLKHKGIIVSTLGSDDDVASLFNELRKNTTIDDNSYLASVFDSVQLHCDKKKNKWKATLNHSYLSNPWVIISVAAAIFLFVLTIMQTVLAFFSYLRPTDP